MNKAQPQKKLCVSCWTAYMLQDGTWSLQYQVNDCPTGKDNTCIRKYQDLTYVINENQS